MVGEASVALVFLNELTELVRVVTDGWVGCGFGFTEADVSGCFAGVGAAELSLGWDGT